ncbi:Ribonuclease H-like protein [Glarea lozoyensis ATCC 20868]|uniref:Ribonuclease H-like protein n=1 Tax=Glarea lozoyensis (strain ATCC 20868 / MF5171) TaxID=1116229 RepID=S3DBD4_GLAL2|nr:Ribonuclease H-like protein [Glarea lozoyensis ATCC 20868]EPE34419.1 Ribonuclease H-like protein [Glarea lozoyensis ATCC 20868]
MARPNFHTNIMLDLECTDASVPNPVIIEMAALHFDIDTGDILGSFTTPVNFQSCLDHGLLADRQEGLDWLQATIPDTLATSKASPVTLTHALFKFSSFLRASSKLNAEKLTARNLRTDQSQLMIWGNGAVADNIWIASAYRVCGMERPWKYYNDMCLRTFVKQCTFMTGKDFAKDEIFEGKKHVALDDCRYQVSYLVKARKHLVSARTPRKKRSKLPSPNSSSRAAKEDLDVETVSAADQTFFGPLQRGLISTETSQEQSKSTAGGGSCAPPQPRKKNGLLTPATSFSVPPPEDDLLESTQPNNSPGRLTIKKSGLISPDTSFVFADDEGEESVSVLKQTQSVKFEGIISGTFVPTVAEPETPKARRQLFHR